MFSVFFAAREIDDLVRIAAFIVEEILVVFFSGFVSSNVCIRSPRNTPNPRFEGSGNHGFANLNQLFVRPFVTGFLVGEQRQQASSLHGSRHLDARRLKQRGRNVEIADDLIQAL